MLQNSLQFQQFSKNVSPIYANNPPKDSQLFDVKSRNIGKEKPWQELSDVFFSPLFFKEGVGNEHSKVELTFID